MLEGMFNLKKKNTTVSTEFAAGFTTFLTMLYIVPVNGFILSDAGLPMEAVITATALITILATFINGIWANTPVAMSVGMGLNAYFTYGLVLGMKIPWQTALGVVFISGLIFLVLSFTKFRVWIIHSIPAELRYAISAGIGAFIAFIGLKQIGIIIDHPVTLVSLGNLSDKNVLLGILGLLLSLALYAFKLRGAFIISITVCSIIGWYIGVGKAPTDFFSLPASITPIALQLDIVSAATLALLPVIITFLITDMFDSLGTLTGIGSRANLFDGKDDEELAKTLEADAFATIGGSLLGLSTTTAFIESASGVEEGGRSGLTAVFTALFFIGTLFMLPLFKSIPSNAIYPVLVVVGVLMFTELGKIDFNNNDLATKTGIFFIVLLMPLTFSITNGIAAGFASYVLIKLAQKKFSDLNLGIIFIGAISFTVFFLH